MNNKLKGLTGILGLCLLLLNLFPVVLSAQDTIPGYPCYETVEGTFDVASSIAAEHPNLATWTDQGDSWKKIDSGGLEGYDMMVLKLTNSAVSGPKPILFITSAIHAKEFQTAPLALQFAKYLIDHYETDADSRMILDSTEIHLMLHANPDGRKVAESEASPCKRKNANQEACPEGVPCGGAEMGVDLNRNFEFAWGQCGSPYRFFPCVEGYVGPSAVSEPETQAIQNYMANIFTDYNGEDPYAGAPANASGFYLDLHSQISKIYWPWAHTNAPPPNTQFQTLGNKLGYFNGYMSGQLSAQLNPICGIAIDYAYSEFGIASFIIELGAFRPSCDEFENTILPDNLNALLYAAKAARAPYMLPLGPDVTTKSIGCDYQLTATIDDSHYRIDSGEPTQNIIAAEYYIDIPPWSTAPPATAHPMSPVDGVFNSAQEEVSATIDTSGLSGDHIVYIRGQDADANWGPVSAVFLCVPCTPPCSGDWVVDSDCTVHYQVNADENVLVTNNAVLKISEDAEIGINLKDHNLKVMPGSGVKIMPGGKISDTRPVE